MSCVVHAGSKATLPTACANTRCLSAEIFCLDLQLRVKRRWYYWYVCELLHIVNHMNVDNSR
jgi:hypothetical protein